MPDLSIIIPTANRQEYAVAAAKVIARACPEAEIVFSDSSREDGLDGMLQEAGIPADRLVYRRQSHAIDVVSNFNHAADAATGRWMMFLGDDDCIGPRIMDVVRWADGNSVDAVVSYGNQFHAVYYWPGVQSRYFGGSYSARLNINAFSGRARPLNALQAVQSALKNFGAGLGWMARAYHGLVHRSVFETILERHGKLFGGVSPDIYSGTLVSMLARKPAIVEWPFVLPGASPRSMAGHGAARTDRADLWTHPHTAPFRGLQWDPLIPEFYSPTVVWSYSFKRAVDMLGDNRLRPNLALLYARSFLYDWDRRAATEAAVRAWGRNRGAAAAHLAVGAEIVLEGGRFATKAVRRLGRMVRPPAGSSSIGDLQDIDAAYRALDELTRRDFHLHLD